MHCMWEKSCFGYLQTFHGKDIEGQSKAFGNETYCYACYQSMIKNHNAKNCIQRIVCRPCKENHPTGQWLF